MAPMDLERDFNEAFRRGQRERDDAHRLIAEGLARLRAALEACGAGLVVEPSDYDGLFVRASSAARLGWWAYLTVNTRPTGLTYTVRAGYGTKNDPDSLGDAIPEGTYPTPEAAVGALADAIEKGLYYLGTLKRP